MEKERFVTLWEYATSPSGSVTADDLFKACCMYLGGAPHTEEAKASLNEAIVRVLADGDNSSSSVLRRIIGGENHLASLLGKTALATTKAKVSLKTILDDDLGDEDDDSSVDEAEAEDEKEPAEGMTILMRGFLKNKDGKLEWVGNWAMSTEAFDTGDKAKFRYEMRGEASSVEKDGRIVSPPASTIFDGSFLVKDANAPNGFIRMDETAVQIRFDPIPGSELKWKIVGNGSNVGGDFTISGELDGATRRLAVFKTYTYNKTKDGSSASSFSDIDEEEEEVDPTELDDLKADQRESFGMVLAEEDEAAFSKKKKKRRMVEE